MSRGFLGSNLPLKIISVVVALVLYLFVMQEKEGEQSYTVEVTVVPPEGYVLTSTVADLELTVAGRTRTLARLEETQLSHLIMRFDSPETHRRIEPSDFGLPAGVEVRSIEPATLSLQFERQISRMVLVHAETTGSVAAGYTTRVRVIPERIMVQGPATDIEALRSVSTQTINIDGLSESETFPVRLRTSDQNLALDNDVEVRVHIDLELIERSSNIRVPVVLNGPTERFSLPDENQEVEVTVRGAVSIIGSLDLSSGLSAAINTEAYEDFAAGNYFVTPELVNLPEGLRVESVTPPQIRLLVEEASNVYQTIPIPLPTFAPIPLPRISITFAPDGSVVVSPMPPGDESAQRQNDPSER